MTPAQFTTIGEFLFGSAWQTPMAALLGVNLRQIGYYVSEGADRRPIPASAPKKLVIALYDKQTRGMELARGLRV